MEPWVTVPRGSSVVRRAPFVLALGLELGLASGCRPTAKPTALVAERSPDPLEPLRRDCAAGVLQACDEYELQRALCLQLPDGPGCDRLRERGELPPAPPPLADAFGCRPTQGPIGPHATMCLAEDRLSIRDASGVWDQWRIEGWQREDTVERVIWVASVQDGPTLWLTPVPGTEPASPLAGLSAPAVGYHVVGEGGLLHATLGSRDGAAEDELAARPDVDEVCRHADACEQAIAAARRVAAPRPAAVAEDAEVAEPEPSPTTALHTWRACHERWSTAAHGHLASTLPPTLPSECGTVQTYDGWQPVPNPPYAWPEPLGG